MLYYDRIDLRKGNDSAKSNNSKVCMVCPYWFFNHDFRYQHSVSNVCHDLLMLRVNILDIAVIASKEVGCRSIIQDTSKSEATRLWFWDSLWFFGMLLNLAVYNLKTMGVVLGTSG